MSVKGWQVVFTGPRMTADLLAAVLEADGLRVEVFGDYGFGPAISVEDSRVMVPDEQAPAARTLIRQAEEV
jgi:hypothetical protein